MEHKKKIVGIVPNAPQYGETEDEYNDYYKFSDTYCERALEAGMTPIGVLPVGAYIRTDALDLCDAFILQGGRYMMPFHMDVIDHALKTGKKLLGICLGCQAIHGYFATKAEAEKRGFTGKISELFDILWKQGDFHFLGRVEGHSVLNYLPRGDKDMMKHIVHLTEGSQAAKAFGCTEVMGLSYHVLCIDKPAPGLVVSGLSDDGITEVIEYGDKIIGTQFHPDADGELPQIFDWLKK